MTVLNVLLTTVKVVLMTVLNVPVSIAAKVASVLKRPSYNREGGDRPYRPVLITARWRPSSTVLLTTVKVVTVRIVPVLITAKVAAIAA
jgi:hypothetical protein